ncbi:hypothetical protein GCM10009867_21850 [Pedococcus aerophilus]|uniref:Uncharacterized protein n=1 Tax=Pedococcus aerophilus TaxID=436356 RepID=A0ABN3UPA7_9MICO
MRWLRALASRRAGCSVPPTLNGSVSPGTNTAAQHRDREATAARSEAFALLLYAQQDWQLRKVQSHEFKEGGYTVARVSIDCVAQDLPGLRYSFESSEHTVDEPILVPVTFMQKGALRQFDMRGPADEPLPVIGRSEYSDLMIGVLSYQIENAIVPGSDPAALKDALNVVLDEDPGAAAKTCALLVDKGIGMGGVRVLDASRISPFAAALLSSLSSAYVLIALLPAEYARRRVVIKYAHLDPQEVEPLGWKKRWRGAAGLEPLRVGFGLSHPVGSASHHLQVTVPNALRCASLTLPGDRQDRNTSDAAGAGVVHVAAPYVQDPGEPAEAEFVVPWSGMRATTWLVTMVTFAITFLGLVLPGGQEALIDAADGAAALLLAIPAVAVAFAAGRPESAIESVLLGPLRLVVMSCALMLLACAGSIVGVLHEPWRTILWSVGAVASGFATAALCSAELEGLLGRARTPALRASAVVAAVLLACGIFAW